MSALTLPEPPAPDATAPARGPSADAAAGGILPLALADLRYETDGKVLIDDISLVLEAGPRTVILGPNGAGKSLLLRLCHGLIKPTAGTVRWRGPDARHAPRRQAMVFQRPVMLRRSVAANVAYALSLRGLPRARRKDWVAEALDMAGLGDKAQQPAGVLSWGEQQRVALARAWVLHPEVLFLDEPTSSLDPAATRAVERIIGVFDAAGTKIVMTTHDIGQAKRMGDEVLFLHHGRLIERSPAKAFFDRPQRKEADAFLKGELLW